MLGFRVTGLVTNCAKSVVAPIRCGNIELDDVLQAFPAVRSTFPMRYLGLPLSVSRLKRIHFQFLEDKVAGKLPPWVAKHVAAPGRVVLVKAVLTAIAIYHITPLELPVEVRKKIDSLRRAYLWAGCDKVTGGKCKVNWELFCKPKIFGGLGILNLEKFATALRLRWLWYEWADPPKTWAGTGTPCNDDDRDKVKPLNHRHVCSTDGLLTLVALGRHHRQLQESNAVHTGPSRAVTAKLKPLGYRS